MFRLTRYMQALANPAAPPTRPQVAAPTGPVVIWNLIRRCNLTCKHCYATSADKDFPGELSTEQVYEVMDDLKQYGVPVLILSGGEPLMRPDIFEISHRAKAMGFYVGLSSNGTLIDKDNIEQIAAVGYDYVGVSLDGMREVHDRFRRRDGAFDESLRGIRLCRDVGIKVGLRFTLTRDNARDLPELLQLLDDEGLDKFYLSHLNYAGRGNKNRGDDAHHQMTRAAMDLLFDTCWNHIVGGDPKEFVTGNNDADGAYLTQWVERNLPAQSERLQAMLERWGGNSSGINIANIDNLGGVHPDTMWWDYGLGSVKDRPFSEIWEDTSDPLMAGLKLARRPVEGRCAECRHLSICGGNSRTRAWQLTGNFWAEDPGCYLSDEEIGVDEGGERLLVRPYEGRGRPAA
ncbi:MAG: heme d1 biosynthesis radical SAM protein NirJ [Chromatiaceae bacterium]|nr:heme d1 biosynthesis radical SAM protein NirJ [Gammaproteobacteria bacterium]MCP5319075.1 heme d1 biosynthesis radical SAM protein NirJ [Chromatiaceae bacterium]MCW5586475.1 heme d1 biosynthesis radical SAM protein NirJ [Chromatiales bacterium]MCP5430261.1 heme d1 biosynthesis radical SAM protein NirJ [Chromatiaceae bacterium]MCP5435143.1 heme d1 biosynthesis radical SAM protein NirJ [Chromatiaceae bacterium]